ncbi:MAG: lysophospholipid acyltransferase family protein, partial [Planctomycetota bacterium]|nr:lysophospholipid acyltransferase family protein [Planctomycetota bacterium]
MSRIVTPDVRRRALSLQDASVHAALASPFRWLRPGLERVTGLRAAADLYARIPGDLEDDAFFDWALRDLDVRFDIDPAELERIPAEGPVLIVANHPFGALEGMALAVMLRRRRPDARILANHLLGRLPEVADLFLLVDPFETNAAARRNLRPLREALRYLRDGHALATFPAGEVATWRLDRRAVVDREWSPAVARLAKAAGGPVVPVWFGGRNGWSFQLAGAMHPALRTMMLPREMFAQRGRRHPVRIGRPVRPRTLRKLEDARAVVDHLRQRVEILAERPEPRAIQPRRVPLHAEPLIDPVPPERLVREVNALPADAKLAEGDGLEVYWARASAIPSTLREIGRLREWTFRQVGEGTGRSSDTDRFDAVYEHLFLWHPGRREIVGAYRVGRTDERLAAEGRRGLYTSTLFRMQRELFRTLGPALELGRSFIRPEDQRSYSGLLMLWKGIAEFCTRDPRYAVLFGPVSISAEYATASQRLIV